MGGPSTFQPYAMAPPVTAPVCGQLKVVHLAKADYSFLDQLQAAADKPPFSTNISLRNEWCIAPEVSNGSFMQSWFLAVKIDSFSGVQGSLVDNSELWRSVPNDAFFSAIRSAWTAYTTSQPAWDSQQPAALREDPDVAQLRASSLGVFISDTPTMALPLMQSRILDVTARARSAGHLADWQREGDINVGWINKLKAQGRATAPGALGASLSMQWTKECKRQLALNKPTITAAETAGANPVQQWFTPEDKETTSRPRSNTGPIGLIIDLHSQWHDEALRAANFITSMGASIIIPSAPPPAAYIALGKPLNSNYTIPRRAPMPDPPAETTVFLRSSSTSLGATKPRDEQRRSVQHRADYYGPQTQPTTTTADNQQHKCEGCGRKGHTPDTCRSREHPNWNVEHATINFADTATGQAVQREARGTHLTCLPPSGVVWDPIFKQWEECQALLDWRHNIERARAKLAGRPVPPPLDNWTFL